MLEHVEVHVVNKSKILPRAKENVVSTKHDGDLFDYQSSSLKLKTNSKQAHNQEIKSVQNKSKRNKEMIKSNKNNSVIEKQTISPKPRQPKAIQSSVENKDTLTKNTLSKESFSAQKEKNKNKSSDSVPPLRKPENKIDSKRKVRKPVERKENSINLIQEKEFDYDEPVLRTVKKEPLVSSFKDSEAKGKTQENLTPRLNVNRTTMFGNDDFLFDELSTVEKKLSEPKLKKDADFYPESPISELNFFKTPCSTRHNSLETFEKLESECIKDSVEEVKNK